MSDKPERENLEDLLNKLIHASRDEPSEFIRPDSEAIHNYLMDAADEEQRLAVEEALASSPEFRREIIGMVADLRAIKKKSETAASVMTGISSRRAPRIYIIPAMAAAAIIVLVAITYLSRTAFDRPMTAEWSLASEEVSGQSIFTNAVRGPGGEAAATSSSPDSAALKEFGLMLDLGFEFLPPTPRPEPKASWRPMVLHIVDESGARVESFTAHIPAEALNESRRPAAWLLTLPARDAYALPMVSDTVTALWPDDGSDRGCLTFIYFLPDGYHAVMGFRVEIP